MAFAARGRIPASARYLCWITSVMNSFQSQRKHCLYQSNLCWLDLFADKAYNFAIICSFCKHFGDILSVDSEQYIVSPICLPTVQIVWIVCEKVKGWRIITQSNQKRSDWSRQCFPWLWKVFIKEAILQMREFFLSQQKQGALNIKIALLTIYSCTIEDIQ